MTRIYIYTYIPVLFALLFSGCVTTRKSTMERRIVGKSIENRPIEIVEIGTGKEIVLLMSTIHGDENQGTAMLERMAIYLDSHPELLKGKTVLIMPLVNPDGFAADTRTNVNGVDLNRNFQAFNRENSPRYGMTSLSEPESRAIHAVLAKYWPDRIVTMHGFLNVMDWDGPGTSLAKHMGAYCELPVRRLGSRPGSLGSYAGETLGIPTITFEFPREARRQANDELWDIYARSILAAVTYPDAPPALIP